MQVHRIEAVENFDRALAKTVEVICITLLGAIVITICVSVFTRFVIFYPLNFADAMAKYLMQWLAFLGVGLAIRSGEHVLVDMFTTRLNPRLRLNLYVFTNVILIGLFAVIVVYGCVYAKSGWGSKDPFVFGVSMVLPYSSVPVGAAYALVATTLATWIAVAKSRAPNSHPDTGL